MVRNEYFLFGKKNSSKKKSVRRPENHCHSGAIVTLSGPDSVDNYVDME